jgi:NhaP-type Na+/H+ and K+/H+ antiporter
MFAAISLIVIIFISLLITRIATIALSHTGLSRDAARFQARSALTGSGFTTGESEEVVNHPVRRKIIFLLMLVGNAGLVTVVSTLILSFTNHKNGFSLIYSVVIIAAGLLLLLWVSRSSLLDRFFSSIIDWALKQYTDIDLRDYAAILHLTGEYQISEFQVEANDWITGKPLKESKLPHEGIIVLGVQRKNGPYIGTPQGDTKILPEDVLTVYGKAASFKELDTRRKGRRGDREHEEAVLEHEKDREKEQQEDEEVQRKQESGPNETVL